MTLPVAPPLPSLFTRVPETFFAPLGARSGPLAWEILTHLYHAAFERTPQPITNEYALAIATDAVWRSPYRSLAEESDASAAAQVPEQTDEETADELAVCRAEARRLLKRLTQSGWLRPDHDPVQGDLYEFRTAALELLEVGLRLARREVEPLPNLIYILSTTLKPDSVRKEPGPAINGARGNVLRLVHALRQMHAAMQESTERIFREIQSTPDLLTEAMDRYQQEVMGRYHQLKTTDNFFRFRAVILGYLSQMEADETVLAAATAWYNTMITRGKAPAREAVMNDLALIREHLERLPELLQHVDERNQRYSSAVRRRLTYLLHGSQTLSGQLARALDILATTDDRDGPPLPRPRVYRPRFLSSRSFWQPRETRTRESRPPVPVVRTAAVELLDPERLFATSGWTATKVAQFVDTLLLAQPSAQTEELAPSSDDEYVRAMRVVTLGLSSDYRFEFAAHCAGHPIAQPTCSECSVATQDYSIPRGTLNARTEAGPSLLGDRV